MIITPEMRTMWLKMLLTPVILTAAVLIILFIVPSSTNPLTAAIGIVCLVFLPGYSLSFFFWPWAKLEIIERLVISIALSLATVPVVMFISSKAGGEITYTNTVIQVVLIIIAAIMLTVLRSGWRIWLRRRKNKAGT